MKKKDKPTEFKRQDGAKIAIHHDGTRSLEDLLGRPLLQAIKRWTVLDDAEFLEDLKHFTGYDPEEPIGPV